MRALIITRTNDNESVAYVTRALERRGARAFRFDTDRFPTEVRARIRIDGGAVGATLEDRGDVLDLSEIAGAWHRRLDIAGLLPRSMHAALRGPSIGESRRVLLGLFASLPCFVIDPTARLREAEHKQLQLQVARKLGLDVPRTLVTNSAEAVRAFWDECSGRVITKMMSGFAVVEEGRDMVVFTNVLAREDLRELEQLALCPMTFQEHLDKALELRVTIVGERVFAASIDSQRLDRAQVDWRREGHTLVPDWKPYALPSTVEQQLLALMDAFGLNYGAIDLILTPEGRCVFLEINPAGEFFWLDRDGALPISDAIADVMLGLAPRRTEPRGPARVGVQQA